MKTKIETIGGKKVITIYYKSQYFRLNYAGTTQKELEWYKSMFEKMVDSFKTDILDSYNEFLMNNGYCDTDIISEEPTALDQFLILNKKS
jgi:hypothetical protein